MARNCRWASPGPCSPWSDTRWFEVNRMRCPVRPVGVKRYMLFFSQLFGIIFKIIVWTSEIFCRNSWSWSCLIFAFCERSDCQKNFGRDALMASYGGDNDWVTGLIESLLCFCHIEKWWALWVHFDPFNTPSMNSNQMGSARHTFSRNW